MRGGHYLGIMTWSRSSKTAWSVPRKLPRSRPAKIRRARRRSDASRCSSPTRRLESAARLAGALRLYVLMTLLYASEGE